MLPKSCVSLQFGIYFIFRKSKLIDKNNIYHDINVMTPMKLYVLFVIFQFFFFLKVRYLFFCYDIKNKYNS